MSGTKYLFDTNTLISFFNGDPGLQPFSQAPILLSVISVIEFLAFPKITDEHKALFNAFLKKSEVIDLTSGSTAFIETIINVRRLYKLKLPDAIIAATAIYKNATLISNDKHFQNINTLSVLNF
jgi:tRNA(fMet)-specific endonuclease VapC